MRAKPKPQPELVDVFVRRRIPDGDRVQFDHQGGRVDDSGWRVTPTFDEGVAYYDRKKRRP